MGTQINLLTACNSQAYLSKIYQSYNDTPNLLIPICRIFNSYSHHTPKFARPFTPIHVHTSHSPRPTHTHTHTPNSPPHTSPTHTHIHLEYICQNQCTYSSHTPSHTPHTHTQQINPQRCLK